MFPGLHLFSSNICYTLDTAIYSQKARHLPKPEMESAIQGFSYMSSRGKGWNFSMLLLSLALEDRGILHPIHSKSFLNSLVLNLLVYMPSYIRRLALMRARNLFCFQAATLRSKGLQALCWSYCRQQPFSNRPALPVWLSIERFASIASSPTLTPVRSFCWPSLLPTQQSLKSRLFYY